MIDRCLGIYINVVLYDKTLFGLLEPMLVNKGPRLLDNIMTSIIYVTIIYSTAKAYHRMDIQQIPTTKTAS